MDEAHTNSGAKGIEISLLLRRAIGISNQNPQYILTSATLGKGVESNPQIVEFAESLTSSRFKEEDIIYSKYDPFNSDQIYRVEAEDYEIIYDNLNNKSKIIEIAEKYLNIGSETNSKKILYDLMKDDKNVFSIYRTLKKKSVVFDDVLKVMDDFGFNETQLVKLINLINYGQNNGKPLFTLKYHAFIRPLTGAYITLNPHKQLKLSNYVSIGGLKAFELGNCRFCNTSYIIGVEQDNILVNNSEIDIYENYDESDKSKQVDYYLIKSSIDLNTIDLDEFEEMVVCSKCGRIYSKNNLNAEKCECGDEYQVELLKVKKADEMKNNLSSCPCCHHRANSGIVRTLNLGKDEATAIVGQIMYDSIAKQKDAVKKQAKKLGFGRKAQISTPEEVEDCKQLLAFSDSRQQASFFATFYDKKHKDFLRKRLIWDQVVQNNYDTISFRSLVARLENKIESQDLFPDGLGAKKEAWVSALYELLKVDGDYGAEGLGLFFFRLAMDKILEQLSDEDIEEFFGQYNIGRDDFETLCNVIFTVFRTTPAINYDDSELDLRDKEEELQYRRFDNAIILQRPKTVKGNGGAKLYGNIRSFLPVTEGSTNYPVGYIKKICGVDNVKATEILTAIYELFEDAEFFEPFPKNKSAYKINANNYVLDNYKNTKYYRCRNCGKLTPFNIHGICPSHDCDGDLEECDPDEIMKWNYYRKQYVEKTIEPIIIREHTAQLTREKAKQYQKDFVAKKINILSCSTTFEMGVDIGALDDVFLRNVPPTPANYVQRAGRAGRRNSNTAFVLTFCNNTSHDYTYFCEPEKMISGIVEPPHFEVLNEKIIVRHLYAAAFGFFFREHKEYYKNIQLLVDEGLAKFDEWISTNPASLNHYIDDRILIGNKYANYKNFKWYYDSLKNENRLELFIQYYNDRYDTFKTSIDRCVANAEYGQAQYFKEQLRDLTHSDVIESLSKLNVIPKYGFPVDLVELQVYEHGKINDKDFSLNRDLTTAITEYAPSSEIIVDKKKYTSRYIGIPKSKSLTKNYHYTCPHCGRINISVSDEELKKCRYCEHDNPGGADAYYVEPIYGFKTGLTKESSTMKPKRTYAGRTEYVGEGFKDEENLKLGQDGYINVETFTDDQLLVMNKSKFWVCEECGYSVKENEDKNYNHKDCNGRDCKCHDFQLVELGHKFKTDVAKIEIDGLKDRSIALSLLYALLEGISAVFNIERQDIDGLVVENYKRQYDLMLYDTVPGGAGHIKRIVNKEALMKTFESALEKVSQECCDEETSCYSCLRNYHNQGFHKLIKRKHARNSLTDIIRRVKSNQIESLESYLKESECTKNECKEWSEMKELFKKNLHEFFDDCEKEGIVIPELIKTSLKSPALSCKVVFSWPSKNVLILSDKATNEDITLISSKGWTVFKMYNIDYKLLKEAVI